jgi:hypothetical protein
VKSRRRHFWWPCLASALIATAACGKKGPPLAPLQLTPAGVEDLTVRRLGDRVHVRFKVPDKNSDGKAPADVRTVEVMAITGEPVDVNGVSLSARDLAEEAKVIHTIEIAPPPPPESEGEREEREKAEKERVEKGLPPPPAPPPDPRPKQGEVISVVETLNPALLTPYVPRIGKPLPPPRTPDVKDTHEMPVIPEEVLPLRRVYVAAGRSKKGRLGPLSARIGVPIVELPPSPPAPTLTYTEQGITVTWTPPDGVRLPVEQPVDPEAQPVRQLFPVAIPHSYNVYDTAASTTGATQTTTPVTPATSAVQAMPPMPVPLNPAPLAAATFTDTRLQFGVERCYVVRTVEAAGTVTSESESSPAACVTPVDTFPPAPPASLAAVGSEGAINLIWEPSSATDLAGYLVLRGTPDGGALQAITPAPIRETTYRDTAVRSGRRYVYAIVAVDTATPPNPSAESNRVEETAR